MQNTTITAINGLRVGHATDIVNITGCTVILCPPNTVGGVDQRGGAPGTRETDLLRPLHLIEHVHAIVLSGGSAYGLRTADGVMQFLRESATGFMTGSGLVVPIVPTAILYDLELGNPEAPTTQMGYDAAHVANDAPVASGNVGVGMGCRVGALMGNAFATKGGLGNAAMYFPNGLVIAALFAVNALGDVMDESTQVLAGLRDAHGNYVGTLNQLVKIHEHQLQSNTVIGVVATNAKLSKEHVNKVAQMAQDGLARAISPAHTMFDGDTIFGLATGQVEADVNFVGAYAAEVTAQAIRDGIRSARTIGGVKAIHV